MNCNPGVSGEKGAGRLRTVAIAGDLVMLPRVLTMSSMSLLRWDELDELADEWRNGVMPSSWKSSSVFVLITSLPNVKFGVFIPLMIGCEEVVEMFGSVRRICNGIDLLMSFRAGCKNSSGNARTSLRFVSAGLRTRVIGVDKC
jgi:uncharacterized membrane protein